MGSTFRSGGARALLAVVSGTVMLAASPARAQGFGGEDPVTASTTETQPLQLSFDRFDTSPNQGPLWLRLPPVPFLADMRETEAPMAFALDPDPIGPPQTLRPVQQARSVLDPAPLGPLARFEGPPPAVAMSSPQVADGSGVDLPQPEETGSVVLRRRY